MEELDDVLAQVEADYKKAFAARQKNTDSDLVNARAVLKKAQAGLQRANRLLNSIQPSEKAVASQRLKSKQTMVDLLDQEINRNETVSISLELTTAQKLNQGTLHAQDARNNTREANEIGMRIVDNLDNQNRQLKNIGNRVTNIQANTAQGSKLVDVMKRKERMVNLLLYGLAIVFLGLDGLCFWLYHHNTK